MELFSVDLLTNWKFILMIPVTYFLIAYILIPYFNMQFYKKQGLRTSFIPFAGELCLHALNVHLNGTFYHKHRQLIKKQPEIRGNVYNIKQKVMVELIDLTLIKQFLNNQDYYFKETSVLGFLPTLFGDGIALSRGQKWKNHRRILSTLLSYEFFEDYIVKIQHITKKHLDKLAKNENLNNIVILKQFQYITGEIIGQLFFGERLNEYDIIHILQDLADDVMDQVVSPLNFILGSKIVTSNLNPHSRKLRQRINEFKKIIYKMINAARDDYNQKKNSNTNYKKTNILELLFEKQLEKENDLTDTDILDEFMTFFIAGMDTTSSVLNMTVYFMDKNPQYKDMVMTEMEEYYNYEKVQMESLNKLETTMMFLKEVMRMETPGSTTLFREALVDHNIGDLKIKKGTMLVLEFNYSNYNPKFYPEPEKFNIERWSEKNPRTDPFQFIPFSAGARNCIGQHLAVHEAKIILAEFLKRFDFKVTDGFKLKMTVRLSYQPHDPLTLNLNVKQ